MQEKKSYKPYYHEYLGHYVCGNPLCDESINLFENKCPKCNCSYDWHEDE